MGKILLKIGELRKQKNISQQTLAAALGVAFQTVSKWENGATMPDITLLPDIAAYFDVTVDQLLGLRPLSGEEYVAVESGSNAYWNERLDYLLRTRKYIWNQDYLEFLTAKVWKLTEPVSVLDCGCGWGFLASFLLPLLPEGSTYTGIDQSEKLLEEAKRIHTAENIRFLSGDFMEYEISRPYDVVIEQTVLRHVGQPEQFLEKMICSCKPGGLVICIDVNRELESDGLYIDGMDYGYLCERPGFLKMWKMELEKQDRDYAVGIRLPFWMELAGLQNVGVRMNDKVNFISPAQEEFATAMSDLMETRGWGQNTDPDEEAAIARFMNHGMTRSEGEKYCRKQRKISDFLKERGKNAAMAVTGGLMISYGWKEPAGK